MESGTPLHLFYDGDGLRTQKTGKSSTNAYKPQVTNYLYDRQYVILETDGQGAASVRYVRGINYISRTSTQQTEEGSQGSRPGILQSSATPVAAARISYFLYNGHGDVVQTVSQEGEVENQYDYDVFGNPTLVLEEAYSSTIRYAGEFYDAESGLYYLRARYYNPYTARFTTEDSYWGEDEHPLSLNWYTYVLNSPLMYWDPTGHWEQGDEKLNPEAQAKLIALTSAYYSAQTELEQDSIRGMAQAIRNDSHSKDTIVTPLQFYTKEIEAVNSEADASRGYMNAEEWFAALKTEGIGTSSTSTRVDEDNYSTSTTTTFGITHIGVQSSASYWTDSETDNMTGKSEAAMSIKYKLEPNDAKFVYSSAREDVSLEQILVVQELMKRNGGKLTKEQYESAGIEVEPDRWDSKTGTHSFYEGNYRVSLHGYTMGDLNDQYIQENLRLEEIFGVFALRVSNEKDLTLTTKKADKVKVEERQKGITKEKEAIGETSSGYPYKVNIKQTGNTGTGNSQLALPAGKAPSGSSLVIEHSPNLKVRFSDSELRAANYMYEQGNQVVLRHPVGTRAGGGTSDLLVNGKRYDVYTPETTDPSRIIGGIAKKNSQAEGVILDLSKTSVTSEQLGNVIGRVHGIINKGGKTPNINDIIILP